MNKEDIIRIYRSFLQKLVLNERNSENWKIEDSYSGKILHLLDFSRQIKFKEPDNLTIISKTWWKHDTELEYFKISGHYKLNLFDESLNENEISEENCETELENMKITRLKTFSMNIIEESNNKDLRGDMCCADRRPNTINEVMYITSIFFALSLFTNGKFEEHTKLYNGTDDLSRGCFYNLILKMRKDIRHKISGRDINYIPGTKESKLDIIFNEGFVDMLESNQYYMLRGLFE